MRCIGPFFHRWGLWEEYTWRGVITPLYHHDRLTGSPLAPNLIGQQRPTQQYREKRHCKDCNRTQDRMVRRDG